MDCEITSLKYMGLIQATEEGNGAVVEDKADGVDSRADVVVSSFCD